MQHEVVSREAWKAARAALLAEEKAFMRQADAFAARQRALPWTEVTQDYRFEGPSGAMSLGDLFGPHDQLFLKYFMQQPGQVGQCVGCSLEVDHVGGILEHLAANGIAYANVSPAPLPELEAIKARMGWRFTWVSSSDAAFFRDIHETFTPDGVSGSGDNIFFRDPDGRIFHTWGGYGRGCEVFLGIYRFIDLMPRARGAESERHTLWTGPARGTATAKAASTGSRRASTSAR